MIHDRIDISPMVIPLEFLEMARRVRTCPRKATKTVVNDNSMLLANAAQSREAVDGGRLLSLEILRPYRGLMMANASQMPENTVE